MVSASDQASDQAPDELEKRVEADRLVQEWLDALPDTPSIKTVSGNQFTQYKGRDFRSLSREVQVVDNVDRVDAHRFVLPNEMARTIFENAARTHASVLEKSGAECGRRFIVARGVGDPTFGTGRTRGREPYPPRYCIFQSFHSRAEGWDGVEATSRWLQAVARVGGPLAMEDLHASFWARHLELQADTFDPALEPDFSTWIVATEVLNANWMDGAAVPEMRRLMSEHAEASIKGGNLAIFDVLQSVDSPTCFKTFELYPSMDALMRHMADDDPQCEQGMLRCRAAVNRVRQIYTPLVVKFGDLSAG